MARPPRSPAAPDEPSTGLGLTRPRWLAPIGFGLAIVFLWAGLLAWLTPELLHLSLETSSAPRASERTRELREAIPVIDQAVARTLLEIAPGVTPLSHHEEQETLHGVRWRSSVAELQLPATVQPENVARTLTTLRFPEGWEVRFQSLELEAYAATLQVSVHGFPTHLLTLHPTLPQTAPIDLEPGKSLRIAILIDDAGMSRTALDPLWELEAPFSLAIIPYTPHALTLAQEAYIRRKKILVHLPMEAMPRPDEEALEAPLGQLTLAMTPAQVKQQTKRLLRAVPYAVGANNHQGSALSRDRERMTAVLEVLKAENMFFVDSRTLGDTAGATLAKSLGVPTVERQVFLDNDTRPDAIRQALGRLKATAVKRGSALGICHPHEATIEVLREWLPQAMAEGFLLVPVSGLLE